MPIKCFGRLWNYFQYWLLLCGKLFAERSWGSLNSFILSSRGSLQRSVSVSQRSGSGMSCPVRVKIPAVPSHCPCWSQGWFQGSCAGCDAQTSCLKWPKDWEINPNKLQLIFVQTSSSLMRELRRFWGGVVIISFLDSTFQLLFPFLMTCFRCFYT